MKGKGNGNGGHHKKKSTKFNTREITIGDILYGQGEYRDTHYQTKRLPKNKFGGPGF